MRLDNNDDVFETMMYGNMQQRPQHINLLALKSYVYC